jgi:hypothetical protein
MHGLFCSFFLVVIIPFLLLFFLYSVGDVSYSADGKMLERIVEHRKGWGLEGQKDEETIKSGLLISFAKFLSNFGTSLNLPFSLHHSQQTQNLEQPTIHSSMR